MKKRVTSNFCRRSLTRLSPVALVAAALVLVPAALAAKVVVNDPSAATVVEYSAGAGEVNNVAIGGNLATELEISDTGASISGCTAAGSGGVRCPISAQGAIVAVDLGNRDDALIFNRAFQTLIRGRAGDDRITGGFGTDEALGGAGEDRMTGRGGGDFFFGEEGPDRLGGGSGDDILDGGSGLDSLNGGSGRDILRGREGDDVLFGGPGVDEFFGLAGNDRINSRDGIREIVDCGAGLRDLVVADATDVLRGCERTA